MSEWRIVNRERTYVPEVVVHMIWVNHTDGDYIELEAAVDEYTRENNPDYFDNLVSEARKKVGAENVRVVQVSLPWTPICDMFEEIKMDGDIR